MDLDPRRGRRFPFFPMVLALLVGGLAGAQSLDNPRRIADGPAGQLLVSDRRHGAIVAVDRRTLEPVWSYPLRDEGAPFGLATLHGLVYVGNTTTKNVEVYRLTGRRGQQGRLRFEYNLGLTPPGETGSIGNPTSIAIDPAERLVFVLDSSSRRIEIFDWRGARMGGFAPVDDTGRLLSPVSVAVDPARREVLVGDYGDPSGSFRAREAARILIYDYDGGFLSRISGDGSTHATTRFVRVQGIAVGPDGSIYVAEPLAGRILVLDRNTGELLDELGSAGDGPGELRLPLDVLLDARSGDVYVTNNRGARRVEVFRTMRRAGVPALSEDRRRVPRGRR